MSSITTIGQSPQLSLIVISSFDQVFQFNDSDPMNPNSRFMQISPATADQIWVHMWLRDKCKAYGKNLNVYAIYLVVD